VTQTDVLGNKRKAKRKAKREEELWPFMPFHLDRPIGE